MRCVECGSERCDTQRGWVTVLTPSGSIRIHYCPGCMDKLVSRSPVADEVDDRTDDQ